MDGIPVGDIVGVSDGVFVSWKCNTDGLNDGDMYILKEYM